MSSAYRVDVQHKRVGLVRTISVKRTDNFTPRQLARLMAIPVKAIRDQLRAKGVLKDFVCGYAVFSGSKMQIFAKIKTVLEGIETRTVGFRVDLQEGEVTIFGLAKALNKDSMELLIRVEQGLFDKFVSREISLAGDLNTVVFRREAIGDIKKYLDDLPDLLFKKMQLMYPLTVTLANEIEDQTVKGAVHFFGQELQYLGSLSAASSDVCNTFGMTGEFNRLILETAEKYKKLQALLKQTLGIPDSFDFDPSLPIPISVSDLKASQIETLLDLNLSVLLRSYANKSDDPDTMQIVHYLLSLVKEGKITNMKEFVHRFSLVACLFPLERIDVDKSTGNQILPTSDPISQQTLPEIVPVDGPVDKSRAKRHQSVLAFGPRLVETWSRPNKQAKGYKELLAVLGHHRSSRKQNLADLMCEYSPRAFVMLLESIASVVRHK